MISDAQGFIRFAVINAEINGPALPEGAVVMWYGHIREARSRDKNF